VLFDIHSNSLPDNKLVSTWLRLHGVPSMGFVRLNACAKKLGCSLSQLCSQTHEQLASVGWNHEQIKAIYKPAKLIQTEVSKTTQWLSLSTSHHFITLECPQYPSLLKQISRPPLFLFLHGNVSLLSSSLIAFVGSRKASIYANQATTQLIQGLVQQTAANTISGLALGVDAACHKASLANNLPTLAVLGCGVDIIYPKRHQQLHQDIASSGALISEFLLGTQPTASLFPRRNRIISGLSLGTIVIEAKIKSGSLITAKYAAEQNREVFALPNNINNPNAEGCHWLIKQGATLIDSINDIIEQLPQIQNKSLHFGGCDSINNDDIQKNTNQSLASDPLLDSVGYSATSIDVIAKRTGMSLSDLLSQLLEYELRGFVASTADGYIKLRG
jgi:DNA processing protein